jgi:hypothetical protein
VRGDLRPDRHALLELDALLHEIAVLRDEGGAARFSDDLRYRWVLHRLWIAAGNEALAHITAIGIGQAVRRFTWSRLASLTEAIGNHLRSGM